MNNCMFVLCSAFLGGGLCIDCPNTSYDIKYTIFKECYSRFKGAQFSIECSNDIHTNNMTSSYIDPNNIFCENCARFASLVFIKNNNFTMDYHNLPGLAFSYHSMSAEYCHFLDLQKSIGYSVFIHGKNTQDEFVFKNCYFQKYLSSASFFLVRESANISLTNCIIDGDVDSFACERVVNESEKPKIHYVNVTIIKPTHYSCSCSFNDKDSSDSSDSFPEDSSNAFSEDSSHEFSVEETWSFTFSESPNMNSSNDFIDFLGNTDIKKEIRNKVMDKKTDDEIKKCDAPIVHVSGCSFIGIDANIYGGVIFGDKKYITYQIHETNFYECHSERGGAIYLNDLRIFGASHVCSYKCDASNSAFAYIGVSSIRNLCINYTSAVACTAVRSCTMYVTVKESKASLSFCNFSKNYAGYNAPAYFIEALSISLDHCYHSSNNGSGSCLGLTALSTSISNSFFISNKLVETSPIVECNPSESILDLTLTRLLFDNNQDFKTFFTISVSTSVVTVVDCYYLNNSEQCKVETNVLINTYSNGNLSISYNSSESITAFSMSSCIYIHTHHSLEWWECLLIAIGVVVAIILVLGGLIECYKKKLNKDRRKQYEIEIKNYPDLQPPEEIGFWDVPSYFYNMICSCIYNMKYSYCRKNTEYCET